MSNKERRFRYVSLDGAKELGRGSHGITYRLNDEQLLKVYTDNSKFSTIEKERLSAKHAFLEGIPSGIAFDIVVTEYGLGVIFEFINGYTLGTYMSEHEGQFDELIDKYVALLRKFHLTKADITKFRSSKEIFINNFNNLPDCYFNKKEKQSLINIVNAVPDGEYFVHNDFHPQNIIKTENGDLMVIDMADVSYGHYIFDFGSIYLTLIFSGSASNKVCKRVTGLSSKQAKYLWSETVKRYLKTDDKKVIKEFEKKCAIIRNLYLTMLIATESNVWSKPVLNLMCIWAKIMLINRENKCIKELSSCKDLTIY